jgi:hypothetical protein
VNAEAAFCFSHDSEEGMARREFRKTLVNLGVGSSRRLLPRTRDKLTPTGHGRKLDLGMTGLASLQNAEYQLVFSSRTNSSGLILLVRLVGPIF